MATKQEVAAWMYEEVTRNGELPRSHASSVIADRFGRQFAPGGRIAQVVLKEWQKLTKGKIIWNAPNGVWRLRPEVDETE